MIKQYISSLDSEVRSGFWVSTEIKKLWNIQINMAVAILDVCKKYNLKIWAIGGTMLGVVRHQGYIPWDDDIDFMMFREDYDKLLQIAPKEFKSPYYFQSPYNEVGYYRGHSQLRYDNTTMILPVEGKMGANFHQGIFIDIFVADGFPEIDEEREKLLSYKNKCLTYMLYRKYPLMRFSSLGRLVHYYRIRKELGNKSKWDDVKLYSYVEKKHKFYTLENSNKNTWTLHEYLPRWVRMNEWFDETIWMKFEMIELPIPAKYDIILKHEFGDYMKFVVGDSSHGSVIVDTEKSYTEYLAKLKRNCFQAAYYFICSTIREVLYKLKLRK